MTPSNPIEHLALPCTQHGGARCCALTNLCGQAPDERGGHYVVPLRAIEHRLDDLTAGRVLQQEAGRTLLQRLIHDRRLIVRRQQEYAGRQIVGSHRRRHLAAVHAGHPEVEQRDIGQVLLDQFQRRRAVVRLTDDVHRAARRQRAHHPFAEKRVIVADHYTHLLGRCCGGHGDEFSGSRQKRSFRLRAI